MERNANEARERQPAEITHLKWTSLRWADRAQATMLAKRVTTNGSGALIYTLSHSVLVLL